MRRVCRAPNAWARRRRQVSDLLRRSRIVTDPEIMTYLRVQVEKRARAEAEREKVVESK